MNHSSRGLLRNLVHLRHFHTTRVKLIDPKTVEEVRIPVPWGHIAGKWWGKKDIQPILAVHGWQDNAGSFDPMAELIPDDHSLLAIDIPGNGLSSHLPPFMSYYYSDAVAVIKRVKKHFGFDKLDLLGHSGGSTICFLFSGTFPEDVKTYCGIDYISYAYNDEEKRIKRMGELIDKKIELALRTESAAKTYTVEEAKQVWIAATKSSLNEKSAGVLLKRGAKEVGGGRIIFSRDHRLKSPDINLYNTEQVYKFAENISSHIQIIRGLDSDFMPNCMKNIPEVFTIFKKNAKSFKYDELPGRHHLHMDRPELCVPLLLELVKKS